MMLDVDNATGYSDSPEAVRQRRSRGRKRDIGVTSSVTHVTEKRDIGRDMSRLGGGKGVGVGAVSYRSSSAVSTDSVASYNTDASNGNGTTRTKKLPRASVTQRDTMSHDVTPTSRQSRDTWLTPYCEVWDAHCGAGAFSAVGAEAASAFRGIDKHADKALVLKHLANYLKRTEPKFARPRAFAMTWKQWSSSLTPEDNPVGRMKCSRGSRSPWCSMRNPGEEADDSFLGSLGPSWEDIKSGIVRDVAGNGSVRRGRSSMIWRPGWATRLTRLSHMRPVQWMGIWRGRMAPLLI